MADSEPMSKKFEDYLNKVAPPNDGKTHTWAIAEDHRTTEHIQWLRTNLDHLQKNYNFQTIGLERNISFNVFLWAYQDGTLERELGSPKKAKDYLRAIAIAGTKESFKSLAAAQTDLSTDAIDHGMRVIAYDSRSTLALDKNKLADWIIYFDKKVLPPSPKEAEKFLHSIRNNSEELAEFSSSFENKIGWLMQETDWLLKKYPQYRKQLQSIETLVEAGHKKIAEGTLTSDALSATVFDAMATKGNRLPIIGAEHLDGFGGMNEHIGNPLHPAHVNGTFGHHLFALGQIQREHYVQKSTVTCTVIATPSVAREMENVLKLRFDSQPQLKAVKGTPIDFLDINTGTSIPMWQPSQNDWRAVELGKNFPMPDQAKDFKRLETAHINPLLMDEIKAPAEKIRAMMNEMPMLKR